MKVLIALLVVTFLDVVAACECPTMKWAVCDGTPCKCTLALGETNRQELDCTKLIPKCYLMKGEMYRARTGQSTRSIGGKPVETAFVDNDGIYDPECENNGKFKAVQCNGTDVCWCVNAAGVRRSDKGDKNIKCEPVDTYWVRLELKHKEGVGALDPIKLKTGIQNALLERYHLSKALVTEVAYDDKSRLIIVDVQKPKGDSTVDLSLMTYYMEKDIKVLPLYKNPSPFVVKVEGTDVSMENILVYYVDEVPPTFTMQKLTGGIIAVIVVVSLVVIAGLLVLFFLRRREKAKYSKAQPKEMDTMS
ncbi:tumor-associated calcium signal transducer 2-like [Xyrauchen texanus]|uniref:tumor-associated calcium signal transducer 2-like n=1 Tax=Xyrauchen texanus TaxID=154827 RepID=UPI00224225D6|nr:tumor-associated calcium signal transducer 2-like [Xyrauchen texanus]